MPTNQNTPYRITRKARPLILAALAVVLLAAAIALYRWYSAPEVQSSGTIIEVTAPDLAAAYAEDPVGADIQYGYSPLQVSGRVKSITAGSAGPVVVMGGDSSLLTVTASFDETDVNRVAVMTLDSQATVLCNQVTLVVDSPALADCRLLK